MIRLSSGLTRTSATAGDRDMFRPAARAVRARRSLLRVAACMMAFNKGFTAPIVMALGGWKTERMLRAAAEAVSGSERMSLAGAPAAPMSGR